MFVGGSSFGYGIDSESMEKNTSVPVVNLGHNAGFGVPFILAQAKKLMKKGDVVFLCIEYLMGEGDYRLIKKTCEEFPIVADLENPNAREELRAYLAETREGMNEWVSNKKEQVDLNEQHVIEEIKRTDGKSVDQLFNKYGDVILHLHREGFYSKPTDGIKTSYRYWKEIELLNQFKAEAETMGVDVYFSFPPHAKSSYERNIDLIRKIELDVRNDLEIEILNTPDELVFEDSYFYDTEYHLTTKGREIRTKMFFDMILNNDHARESVIRARDAQK